MSLVISIGYIHCLNCTSHYPLETEILRVFVCDRPQRMVAWVHLLAKRLTLMVDVVVGHADMDTGGTYCQLAWGPCEYSCFVLGTYIMRHGMQNSAKDFQLLMFKFSLGVPTS